MSSEENMKAFRKSVLYLSLRYLLVTFLSFMTYTLVARSPRVLAPIMAVFYFCVTMYFFVYTLWYEGCRDISRVKTGAVREFPAKGFAAGGVLGVVLSVFYVLPRFLPSGSTVHGIFYLIKSYLMLPCIYAALPFVDQSMSESEFLAWKTQMGSALELRMDLVFFGFLLAWIIGGGIGYLLGYKDIHPLRPFLDKWKKD